MTSPNAELLRSLGQLARGLSALFWGLPAALIVCAETARASWLKPLEIVPPLVATGLLLYGLWQMGRFQKQERPWRSALDRAKLLGLVTDDTFDFPLTQEHIADALGLSLVHTNKTLAKLRRMGMFKLAGGKLTMTNPRVLARVAQYFDEEIPQRPLI